MRLPARKTKIICTIGPASRSGKTISDLIKAGMSAARFNFSHDTLEEHGSDMRSVRAEAEALDARVPILVDLPGPKIRIGTLEGGRAELKSGARVTLTVDDVAGNEALIPVNYEMLPEIASPGSPIYLSDGFIQLKVRSVHGRQVQCTVMIGGTLLSRQGLNLPGSRIFLDAITGRDLEIIDFSLEAGADIFCLSFINRSDDVVKAREYIRQKNRSAHLIAKIERAEAVRNIDEILDAADGIMVARGDLGMEIPLEEVPAAQKLLIRRANLKGKPVITATQMLESMTQNVRPTRAEVADVANAILDGTDAVMLSGETAIGRFPVESVGMMARIARSVESGKGDTGFSGQAQKQLAESLLRKKVSVGDIISINVIEATRALPVKLIAAPTHSGRTPRRISRFKPACWIIAFCRDRQEADFLNISYGVSAFRAEDPFDRESMFRFLKDNSFARQGDRIIITEMVSPGRAGGIDLLGVTNLP